MISIKKVIHGVVCGVMLFSLGCAGNGSSQYFHAKKVSVQPEEPISDKTAKDNILDRNQPKKELSSSGAITEANREESLDNWNFPVFMFHHIANIHDTPADHLNYQLSLSPANFEVFLDFFQKNGIETLTFRDILEIKNKKKKRPKKAVILTFDDGYRDNFHFAFPLLEKYHMKGVFFIISSKPGTHDWYMDWDQVKELASKGHEIGSHTHSHPDLAQSSIQSVNSELASSKNIIEEKIGEPVVSLCYPAGKFHAKVIQSARDIGYVFGRTVSPGRYKYGADPFEIPIIRIFPTTKITSIYE